MSKNLFQLIKKLSPNEKGYFKKVSKIHSTEGNNIYLRLFDILDKQTHYDKKKVDASFGNKKTIEQLPVLSNYLYHSLLDTLEEFHSGKTAESKLKKLIGNAEQLFIKGLYEQARSLINKVKIKAEQGENFLLILQIYAFEGRLALVEQDLENLKKHADLINDSQKMVHEKYKNYSEYRQLVSHLFYLSKSSGRHLKSEHDQLELQKIMSNPLLADRSAALSVSALNNFLLIHSYYHDIKKDKSISESTKYNVERLKLMEDHIEYTSQSPHIYISALNNVLLNAGEAYNLTLFKLYLDKIKNASAILKIKFTPEVEDLRNFTYIKYRIFQGFISGDFQEALHFIKGKENSYYTLHIEKSKEDALIYCQNLSLLFFGVGDLKKSLHWLNEFLQSGQEILRMDMWILANWTNIAIQIELENFEFSGSLVRSFIRFLSKKSKEFVFEQHFAKGLKGYIDSVLNDKQSTQLEKLKQLKTTLNSYKKSGEVHEADFSFLLPWIKSKIEKRPYIEVYKKSLPEFSKN